MQISHPFYPQNLIEMLEKEGIPHHIHHHEAVFTVAEADKVSVEIPGAHTRNLFLKDKKGKMALITLEDHHPLDLKKAAELIGLGRMSFGSPERLWTYLGVKAGSVTPLAILNDTNHHVELILDESLMQSDIINVHPLDNTMTVSLTPAALLDILSRHQRTPRIIDLSVARPN